MAEPETGYNPVPAQTVLVRALCHVGVRVCSWGCDISGISPLDAGFESPAGSAQPWRILSKAVMHSVIAVAAARVREIRRTVRYLKIKMRLS